MDKRIEILTVSGVHGDSIDSALGTEVACTLRGVVGCWTVSIDGRVVRVAVGNGVASLHRPARYNYGVMALCESTGIR